MSLTLDIVESMQQVDSSSWDALALGMPLLSYAFLCGLEESNSVGIGTGWQPCPLLVRSDGQLVGAMPLLLPTYSHSTYERKAKL